MILLNQLDLRWAKLTLTPSKLTVGRYGCTTTATCMLSDYFGEFTLPSVAAGHQIQYNSAGLILWDKINFKNFAFKTRFYGFEKDTIDDAIKNPDKAVILEVNHSHWVVATGQGFFGDYAIADPWGGIKTTLRGKGYTITGGAVFIRK